MGFELIVLLAKFESSVTLSFGECFIELLDQIFDAAAIPVLVATGLARMAYGRFLTWNVAVTLPKAAVLMALGYCFGGQAIRYLDRGSAFVVLIALAAFLAARVLSKRISKEDDDEGLDR